MLKLKSFLCGVLGLSTFYLCTAQSSARVEDETRAQNTFLSCKGGGEIDFRVNGSFYLNQEFLDESKKTFGAGAIKDAVLQQLRYTQGYLVNQKKDGFRAVMRMSTEPVIESIQVKKQPYPYSFKIDPVDHPDAKSSHPYLLAALKRGRSTAGDSGLKISYSAKLTTLYCTDNSNQVPSRISIDLPSEPYLAYWMVKPEDRRRVTWHLSEFKVNPCANSEFADIPNPYFYWYFWEPRRAAVDGNGQKFNCRNFLKEGQHFASASAIRTEIRPVHVQPNKHKAALSESKNPLQVTALFGVIDHKGDSIDFKKALQKIASSQPIEYSQIQQALKINRGDRPVDQGALNVANFVSTTRFLLDPKTIRYEVDLPHETLIIHGKLTRSHKEARIRVYFGQTDVLTTVSSSYWNALAFGLQNDDVVLYSGHSGLGENAKLSNVLAAIQKSETDLISKSPRHQVLGFFSCYSYSYFGDEIAEARSKSHEKRTTDIIKTASAFTTEKGHFIVIDQIDSALAQNEHSIVAREFNDSDFVLVTHVGALRAPAAEEKETGRK